jgi:protein TonB
MKGLMKRRFKLSILVSLLLHLSVLFALIVLEKKSPSRSNDQIDLTFIETQPQTTEDELNKQKMQIVDQSEKSTNDEIPKDAKYLSRKNQKVFEETRAAQSGHFNNSAGQGIVDPGPNEPSKTQPKRASVQKARENLGERESKPAPWEVVDQKTKSGLPTLEALKPKFDWSRVAGGQAQRRPTAERPGEMSATDDYLKDVKTGAQTMLSTREFIYFSYYNRIKRQLQQHWEPQIKDKVVHLFKQGRQIASAGDRVTRLRITLDKNGTLVGVAVLGQSGVTELDNVAVDAFRQAAPFPNPPAGIVEPDGTIKIDWSFILEASAFEVPHPQFASAE